MSEWFKSKPKCLMESTIRHFDNAAANIKATEIWEGNKNKIIMNNYKW